MPYDGEDLDRLYAARSEWGLRLHELKDTYTVRAFVIPRAAEYASHGLSRRLGMLDHCLDRIFDAIPPDEAEPAFPAQLDATAFIQTFVINLYGAIDNLAHIWCEEQRIVGRRGKPLRRTEVGLRPKNEDVVATLSEPFRRHLTELADWFAYLENYRDALAHRIPLYIPPRVFDAAAEARYRALEQERLEALRGRDRARYHQLGEALRRVGAFEPVIMHSFGEQASPMRFHGQLICDLAAVVVLGEMMLTELEFPAGG